MSEESDRSDQSEESEQSQSDHPEKNSDEDKLESEGSSEAQEQELEALVYEEDSIVKDASKDIYANTPQNNYQWRDIIQYSICSTSTGWNLPFKRLRKTDLKEFGVGICIYFKWLKYLICMFLIATIISVPLFVFYIGASTSTYTSNKTLDTLLELTTLGNMGGPTTSCSKASTLTSKVQVKCSSGTIDSIAKMGARDSKNSKSSCVNNGASLEVISTCDYESFATAYKNSFSTIFNTKCYAKKNCQIDLSQYSWPSTCNTTSAGYFKIYCESDKILNTFRNNVGFIVIAFDILCILFIWISLEVHDTYEQLEDLEINDVVLDGSDFTVQIANVPAHEDVRILKAQICKYIEVDLQSRLNEEQPQSQDMHLFKIAQCNLALTKYSIMSNFKTKMKYNKQFKILDVKESILKNSTADSNTVQNEKLKLERQRIKLKAKFDTNEQVIAELKNSTEVKAVRIYITMQNMSGKKQLIEMLQSRKRRRCCGLIKSNDLSFQNKQIQASEAPKASTIIWENLAVSKKERCVRVLIVYLFSFALILISFAVMLITKNYQRELNETYNVSSCTSTVTMDMALKDYLNPKGERNGFMFCYCLQQYNDMGISVKDIVFTDNGTYCSSWYTDYMSTLALVYILAFTMQIINVIVKTILRLASKLEKRVNKADEVISNIFKMSLTQLINTAILLLVVNMKVSFMPSWFPIFAGDYSDFTTSWYSDVGATIMIMMLFSIVTPHIANFFLHFVRFVRRCFDRKCTCNRRQTRKLFQIDYESLYLGPEYLIEFRYSNMIAMVYLTLLFGAGMPILYFFAACIFFVVYWVDKVTLFKIYRQPPRLGIEVIRFVRNLLMPGIVLHFGFTFWMFSNSLIFGSYSQNMLKLGSENIDSILREEYSWLRIDHKINQYHTFIYAIMFGCFIIAFVLKNTIKACFTKLCCKRLISHNDRNNSAFSANYFCNLQKAHLESIINKTKSELQTYLNFFDEIKDSDFYDQDKENVLWYTDKLKSIISEGDQILMLNDCENSNQNTEPKLFVSDHSYDIAEIFPYSVFLENETIFKPQDNSSDHLLVVQEYNQQFENQQHNKSRNSNKSSSISDLSSSRL